MYKYAVFVDLNSMRLGVRMFEQMMSDLMSNGTVEHLAFYNYNARRHREFRAVIERYDATVDPSLQGKRRVRVDIREALDAVRIASTRGDITTVVLVMSEVDAEYLVDTLISIGKRVVIASTSPSTMCDRASGIYVLDRSLEVDDMSENSSKESIAQSSTDFTHDITEYNANMHCAESRAEPRDRHVIGNEDSIFPYSDIDVRDIDEKMAEIDRRILRVIEETRNRRSMAEIFGDKIG